MVGSIKQICIFIVCAQMIMHFKPAQKYEKYMKLLIGIMVLVQLFVPLMTLFFPSTEAEFADKLAGYEAEVMGAVSESGKSTIINDENITKMQVEEIKSILNNLELNESQGEQKEKSEVGGLYTEVVQNSAAVEETQQTEIYIERIEVKPDE